MSEKRRTKNSLRLSAFLFVAFLFLMGILGYIAVAGAEENTIRVIDHTESWISPVVQETVRDFNRNMPKSGPRIEYIRGETILCVEDISVCSGYVGRNLYGWAAWENASSGEIHISNNKNLHGNRKELENTVCHEMMHIVARVGRDNHKHPDTSCIFGSLPDLGPFDVKLLRREYR